MTSEEKDLLIASLKERLEQAKQEIEDLRDVKTEKESDPYDWDSVVEDDTEEYVALEYDRLELAKEVIENHITDEMLKTAARTAAVQVETIRDVYIDGAMLGISTLREAILDMVSARKTRK